MEKIAQATSTSPKIITKAYFSDILLSLRTKSFHRSEVERTFKIAPSLLRTIEEFALICAHTNDTVTSIGWIKI
jgi:hypothetical protein